MTNLYAGSKDETFFDSNVWLDSDCDDDFLSVNGGKILRYIDCVYSTCFYLFVVCEYVL